MKQNILATLITSLLICFSTQGFAGQPQNNAPCPNAQSNNTSPNSHIYTQGSTVTTSPLIGVRSSYDASDLIVNMPSMNEDLRFLQQRQTLKKELCCNQLPNAARPILELSGDVVGQVSYQDPFEGHSTHNIDLTGARFDVLAEISRWVLGYISLDYDNNNLDAVLSGSGSRISNSRIFLKRGFLTIGDLDAFPAYFSLGQMFVPFGRYASFIVSSPVTVSIAQTNARALLIGVATNGFYGSTYAFKGDSDVASTGINQWGVNAGYVYNCDGINVEIGAGYIANIADSTGMQFTGNSLGFEGFAKDSDTEMLGHRVPAYDVHAEFGYEDLSLAVEYVGMTRSFDTMDLMYNYSGANPDALHAEASYKFQLFTKPSRITVAYGHTDEALGLGLAENSYTGAFSMSLWKNTIESIEYRHDSNYSSSDVSGGAGSVPDVVSSAGGSRNTVLGQIGVYF